MTITTTQLGTPVNSWSLTNLPEETVGEIFEHCFYQFDLGSCRALACTNMDFYRSFEKRIQEIDLEELCPLLTIISAMDAEDCGIPVRRALPAFSKFKVFKAYQAMSPHIEANAGVTYFNFFLPPQTTLKDIVQFIGDEGITAHLSGEILSEIGNVAVGQIFPGMGTNNVFKHTRGRSFDKQVSRVNEHGCQLPTVEQCVLHIFFTQKIFKRCLFGKQSPQTFGCASTLIGVGDSDQNSLTICSFPSAPRGDGRFGAGGWLKF